jgi:myo-inositol-1(or 4)-monophosphatase
MTGPEILGKSLDTAREAALKAAAVLEKWRSRFKVREKGRFDPVTEADLESQRTIREYIASRCPGHVFLGEEDEAGPAALRMRTASDPAAPPTWIVDPLDGTTNYIHDCPLWCVSIGLEINGELVVGVVYDPSRQEMFSAGKGKGAWLNGKPIRTSSVGRLEEALLATGFPPDLKGHERTLDWWRYFSFRAHSLRRTGSTALNLAYVACGRFDGYWAFDNHPWDVAGAAVLVREAGGTITNADGSPFNPYTPDAVASNGPLHAIMLECLASEAVS